MKTLISYSLSALLLLAVISCNKVIDLKLGDKSGELVIEGNITDIPGPKYIKLSQSVPFSNTNTYPPVSGATVSVTDQEGHNYLFTEGPTGTYKGRLTGFSSYSYTLTVLVNGKSYAAASTMPYTVALDSVTSRSAQFDNKDNKREISVHYQDPPDAVNQYRFILYVNDVQVKQIYADNDDFTNGRYVDFDLRTGSEDPDIHPGDKVTVEMQCTDKPIYTYWFTLMQQGFGGPGGGVTPANPPGNITPDCLGYFSAHTTQSKTIIVK